jgi:hypothetical protein
MERLLLVWDEIDDLVGVGRCVVSRAMMRMSPATTRVGSALLVTQKSLSQLW